MYLKGGAQTLSRLLLPQHRYHRGRSCGTSSSSSSVVLPGSSSSSSSSSSSFNPAELSKDQIRIKDEILSRVTLVDSVEESAKLVDRLIERGQPIGVDMEGVTVGQVGMVQIKAPDNKIYIFRPARHPRLLSQGKLKNLLEAHQVLKIFHASTNDVMAANRNGVKLWSLYDTCIAQKVIGYQRRGRSTMTVNLSFQNISLKYGVFVNPVKDRFVGRTWNKIHWHDEDSVSEELLFYSACDVEPLFDLHRITQSLLDPEFLPLLRELHEIELLRCIDPRIANLKVQMRKQIEASSVFLSGLDPSVSPAHLYESLCHIYEMRKITFSPTNRAAHLHFENRKDAVSAFHEVFTEREKYQHLGTEVKAALVRELLPKELIDVKREHSLVLESLRDDTLIRDNAVMSNLVDKLILSQCPIVCNFVSLPHSQSAVIFEVYTGRSPTIKFKLDRESAVKGKLGALLASDDVPKVVKRTDASNVYTAVKICYAAGFMCKNIYGISDGFKIIPFLRAGQSFFIPSPLSLQNVAEVLGMNKLSGRKTVETQLLVYQYLVHTLPPEMLKFWAAKCQVDLHIGTNTEVAKAKNERKIQKEAYETRCFHVTCVRGRVKELESVLKAYLDKRSVSYEHIIVSGRHALISILHHPSLRKTISGLRYNEVADGLMLQAKEIKYDPNLDEKTLYYPMDEEKLRLKIASQVQELNKLGVYDGIVQPISDSKRTKFDSSNRNLDKYRSVTR